MKNIILTKVHGITTDGRGKVAAVKDLRRATGSGLSEALDIVTDIQKGKAHEVSVREENIPALGACFSWVEPAPADPQGISRDDVLQFVFDVLAESEPKTAYRIMALESYVRVKEALR